MEQCVTGAKEEAWKETTAFQFRRMNTATRGSEFEYPKLGMPSLTREGCRVPGTSAREAFPTPSIPRAMELGQSGCC